MLKQTWVSSIFPLAYILLIILFAFAIIMKRRPVGVALSWLVLLFALPLVGMMLYLILGSQLLGKNRLLKANKILPVYHQWRTKFSLMFVEQWGKYNDSSNSKLYRFIENSMGIPALPGNSLQLFSKNVDMLECIINDIEKAKKSIILQFYIIWPEGKCEKLIQSVIDAQNRGIICKILVDAVGSRYFLKHQLTKELIQAGVEVASSLPVGIVRMFFERIDVRNHRKIIIIDEHIAWTGSFNLADPNCFKQKLKVGKWIDAMLRVKGPSSYMISMVFFWDWQLATHKKSALISSDPNINNVHIEGTSFLHVLPSNPHFNRERLHQALLTAIYQSEKEIIITTPYFVPDDALFSALISASKRGVDVQLILPKKTDSRIARFASRSYYQTLLENGASIFLFKEGLLHTKCVLVDNKTVLFGSVNMDMRSVWLNMELTLVIYDQKFSMEIADMLAFYKLSSRKLTLNEWKSRSFLRKIGESVAQLASPLL